MPSILELRHLHTLYALSRAGSLAKAAEWLHLTQSALSHQIKDLEAHYEVSLFHRKSQPLRFSPAGERLLSLARQVLPAFEEAERDLSRMVRGQGGELRIAVECHTCFDWLMPAMQAFRPRWPEVELDLVTGFTSEPASLLEENKADLVLSSRPETLKDRQCHPLFSYPILAVLAPDHPFAEKSWLDPEDFKDQTLITYPVPERVLDIYTQVLHPAGLQPARRTSELTNAILQLVASRRGLAALPLWALTAYLDQGSVVVRPITQKGLTARLYALVRPGDSDLAYLQDFIALVRRTCQESLSGIHLFDDTPALG